VKRWLAPVVLIAALIGAWQLAASSGAMADLFGVEDFLVPSPSEIGDALWQNRSLLAENAWVTLKEMLIGFAMAVVIGAVFAVTMHVSELVRLSFYPPLVALQTVPVLVFSPVLVVWFGFGIAPKIAIVAIVCFFPITVSSLDGFGAVDPDATKLMRTIYASRSQILRRLDIPTALPGFFSGTKIAVVFTPIAAVFAEWAGSSAGLGHMILQDNAQLATARVFAAVAVLSAMAIALFALVSLTQRLVISWR
jgi:ABC-type nitrate/sulfonate/bicarbonate transport system permease component